MIAKIDHRLADLRAIKVDRVFSTDDANVVALEKQIDVTVADLFGVGTREHQNFLPPRFSPLRTKFITDGRTIDETRAHLRRWIAESLNNLKSLKASLQSELATSAEPPETRAQRVFDTLDLQQEIQQACGKLFADGHYSNAVEAACKALEALVQSKAARNDVSGTALMRTVFSSKTPVLKFNDQTNDSERSEQEGMMHLFEGAVLALRNPRAHSIVKDHPERAVEYLSFISMLARSLDRVQRA